MSTDQTEGEDQEKTLWYSWDNTKDRVLFGSCSMGGDVQNMSDELHRKWTHATVAERKTYKTVELMENIEPDNLIADIPRDMQGLVDHSRRLCLGDIRYSDWMGQY